MFYKLIKVEKKSSLQKNIAIFYKQNGVFVRYINYKHTPRLVVEKIPVIPVVTMFDNHPTNPREYKMQLLHDISMFQNSKERNNIHPTAIVNPDAIVKNGVTVGPFCVIGPNVVLEENVHLKSHVVVSGESVIGEGTIVYPFSTIGEDSQDKKDKYNYKSKVEIGSGCVIRENVTIHRGTKHGGGITKVGNNCWILAGAHVAHDCTIGNGVVLSNDVCLAGHVQVGDKSVLGGQVGVRQFVKIGRMSMIGAKSAIDKDVIPYGLAVGNRASLIGMNLVGLRRANIPRSEVKAALETFRYLFGVGKKYGPRSSAFARPLNLPPKQTITQRLDQVLANMNKEDLNENKIIDDIISFIRDHNKRSRQSLCLVE